ncbi:chemotaxis protein [Phormidium pseudopriestleyi FRX01]|uniref:Chemotaxis protein n=1 Tax=Phormidium pseudopriestleyi FRX01 TaxID=1759528 RepID=A0ABS3FSG9_9CYAN|nr:methyl-accepting chemotaxis protein [Phormidium pseudopriestleyi]MBO0349763.1 chemotaxis protein [Phormidium pseudopriestleyi FRX01]
MDSNRKLNSYIWRVALLPFGGLLILLVLLYSNREQAQQSWTSLKPIATQNLGSNEALLTPTEQQLGSQEIRNLETSLNNLQLTLILGGLIELGLMAYAVWAIASGVNRRVEEVAQEITESSRDISTTMTQQERIANDQAASVNQTTTTMDELGASSRQSAEQAEAAAADARNALVLTEGGSKAVERTLADMSALKAKVGEIAEQILRLSEQTSQIRNISGLVSDLATQTNMLALNAAVEAVRAGEHGKGFAVVASEIRKLADQSQKSTEKINGLVSDIQSAINSTVIVTDEGSKTVQGSLKIAKETAEAFEGVTEAINNITLSTQQISLSAKQQAIAIQQVVEAMNSLNKVASQTALGISQVKTGTDRLNSVAQNLKQIV